MTSDLLGAALLGLLAGATLALVGVALYVARDPWRWVHTL